MGRNTQITQQGVNHVAELLIKQGQKVNIPNVRAELGVTGSNSTIQKLINVWQASQITPKGNVNVPTKLIDYLADFVYAETSKVREEYESKIQDLKLTEQEIIKESDDRALEIEDKDKEIEKLKIQNTEIATELKITQSKITDNVNDVIEERKNSEKCRTEIKVLKTRLDSSSKQIRELKDSYNESRAHLEKVRGQLDTAHIEAAEFRGRLSDSKSLINI